MAEPRLPRAINSHVSCMPTLTLSNTQRLYTHDHNSAAKVKGLLFEVPAFGEPSVPVLDENGRGTGTRTRDLRFWRPSLYQLSYTPTTTNDLRQPKKGRKRPCARFLRIRYECSFSIAGIIPYRLRLHPLMIRPACCAHLQPSFAGLGQNPHRGIGKHWMHSAIFKPVRTPPEIRCGRGNHKCRLQRTVHQEVGIFLNLAGEIQIIVDSVTVERAGGISKQPDRIYRVLEINYRIPQRRNRRWGTVPIRALQKHNVVTLFYTSRCPCQGMINRHEHHRAGTRLLFNHF